MKIEEAEVVTNLTSADPMNFHRDMWVVIDGQRFKTGWQINADWLDPDCLMLGGYSQDFLAMRELGTKIALHIFFGKGSEFFTKLPSLSEMVKPPQDEPEES